MERGTLSENGSLFWPHDQHGGGREDHGHYHQAHHHYQQRGHLHHQHDEHHHHRIMNQMLKMTMMVNNKVLGGVDASKPTSQILDTEVLRLTLS